MILWAIILYCAAVLFAYRISDAEGKALFVTKKNMGMLLIWGLIIIFSLPRCSFFALFCPVSFFWRLFFTFYSLIAVLTDTNERYVYTETPAMLFLGGVISHAYEKGACNITAHFSLLTVLIFVALFYFFIRWLGFRLTGRESIGFGDFLMMATWAIWLPFGFFWGSIALGSFIGALFGYCFQKITGREGVVFSFIPFLFLGIVMSALFHFPR